MSVVHLKPKRARSIEQRHPWVFSGALASVDGDPADGEVVTVVDSTGAFVAHGYYNARSKIRVRLLEWDESVRVDDGWWRRRVFDAVDARAPLADDPDTDAYRLIHAEADLLPGVIADQYGDVLVVQFLTAGAERARGAVLSALGERCAPAGVYERSDTASRTREGLRPVARVLSGDVPESLEIREHGARFRVSVTAGQKTGFYLDQRDNRRAVAEFAAGRRVLDAFSYTGGFSVYAGAAGAASLTLADTSAPSLEAAAENLALNGTGGDAEFVTEDVFELLRTYRDSGRRFDMAVLDPPKFATHRHQAEKALRGYKDINMLAMRALEPGGILATFSCSAGVGLDAFTLAVSWAGMDAGRSVQIVRRLSQGLDHPVLTAFPESEYLKGLICRIV